MLTAMANVTGCQELGSLPKQMSLFPGQYLLRTAHLHLESSGQAHLKDSESPRIALLNPLSKKPISVNGSQDGASNRRVSMLEQTPAGSAVQVPF